MVKKILITGGLGKIAFNFIKNLNNNDFIFLINIKNIDDIKKKRINFLKKKKFKFKLFKTDISREYSVKKMFERIVKEYKDIDILINNAASIPKRKKIINTSFKEHDEIIKTNINGLFLSTKYFLEYCDLNKKKFIMNISSNSSVYGGEKISTYSSTKAFMNTFTKAISRESRNIHAISLLIGRIKINSIQKNSRVISFNELINKLIYVIYNYKKFKNGTILKLEEIINL